MDVTEAIKTVEIDNFIKRWHELETNASSNTLSSFATVLLLAEIRDLLNELVPGEWQGGPR